MALNNPPISLDNPSGTRVTVADVNTALNAKFAEAEQRLAGLTAADASISQSVAAKYAKPASGIPSSDLASAAQASLAKADGSIQSLAQVGAFADLSTSYPPASNPQSVAQLGLVSPHEMAYCDGTAWNMLVQAYGEGALLGAGLTPASVRAMVHQGVSIYNDKVRSLSGKTLLRMASTGNDMTAIMTEAVLDMYASKGGTTDQNTAYNTGFCIELMDGDTYPISTLPLVPGMALVSASRAMVSYSDKPGVTSGSAPVSSGPVISHISPNQPLFYQDTSRGVIRQGSTKFGGATLLGLTMTCDRFTSNRRGDADFIKLVNVFGFTMMGCLAFTPAGFGLRVILGNALNIMFNTFMYAPTFGLGIVDSTILMNQAGGSNGFASDTVWLTGDPDNGVYSRISNYQSNIWFNNQSNGNYPGQFAEVVNVTAVSGDTLTLSQNVGVAANLGTNWVGETPVIISSTGNLPTATGVTLNSSRPYWVTVLAAGNQIKLSTTRTNKYAGTYISFTDLGSGTVSLQVGGNANLHCDSGSRGNNFMPIRLDQAYGAGLYLNGSKDNTFAAATFVYQRMGFGTSTPASFTGTISGTTLTVTGASTSGPRILLGKTVTGAGVTECTITGFGADTLGYDGTYTVSVSQNVGPVAMTAVGAGYKDPAPGAAIVLRNGATGNKISGSADGIQHGPLGAGHSYQMYAVDCDASSRRGLDLRGLTCFNHNTGNSMTGARAYLQQELNPNVISVPPSRWIQVSGTVTRAMSLADKDSLTFAAASSASAQTLIPAHWQSLRVRIRTVNTGTTAGTATWGVRMASYADGASVGSAIPTLGSTTNQTIAGGAGDQNVEHDVVVKLGVTDALIGSYVGFRVFRSDASGPTLQVLDVVIEEDV